MGGRTTLTTRGVLPSGSLLHSPTSSMTDAIPSRVSTGGPRADSAFYCGSGTELRVTAGLISPDMLNRHGTARGRSLISHDPT